MRILLVLGFLATSLFADTWVNGYTKKDGTYVPGHWRSDANDTKNDNYSTQGNTNPYTGERGTKRGDDYGCVPRWVPGYTDSDGVYHPGHMTEC
jgi:hypothetical protein